MEALVQFHTQKSKEEIAPSILAIPSYLKNVIQIKSETGIVPSHPET